MKAPILHATSRPARACQADMRKYFFQSLPEAQDQLRGFSKRFRGGCVWFCPNSACLFLVSKYGCCMVVGRFLSEVIMAGLWNRCTRTWIEGSSHTRSPKPYKAYTPKSLDPTT